jgi:hypothetical protein
VNLEKQNAIPSERPSSIPDGFEENAKPVSPFYAFLGGVCCLLILKGGIEALLLPELRIPLRPPLYVSGPEKNLLGFSSILIGIGASTYLLLRVAQTRTYLRNLLGKVASSSTCQNLKISGKVMICSGFAIQALILFILDPSLIMGGVLVAGVLVVRYLYKRHFRKES